MVNTKVTLCGIEMDNPIIPASGTFGFGYEFAELYDINMLGTFSFKGTTREPRFGNPTPRIAEYAGGLLNAVGLQNPGVDAVIETELPKLKQVFHKPVMANISGFSVAEYAEVCEKLDAQEQVGWLEVNISCPNVHGGGAAFGADPKSAAEVTKAVRAVTKKPIILKLSPTAANIAAVAKACVRLQFKEVARPEAKIAQRFLQLGEDSQIVGVFHETAAHEKLQRQVVHLPGMLLAGLLTGLHLPQSHHVPQDQGAGLEHVGGGGLVHSAAKVALELAGDHFGELRFGIFSHNSSSCTV